MRYADLWYLSTNKNKAMSKAIPDVLQSLYLKNLAYFKIKNPNIHHVITNTTPDHTKIIINKDGTFDLNYNNRKIYNGDAISFVEDEVKEFSEINRSGTRQLGTSVPAPDLYNAPRYFQKHLNSTIKKMYDAAGDLNPAIMNHGGRYDFLVVMGVGLGLHISEILDRLDVQNLLIVETDHELLTMSCFFTDWEEVYKKQDPKENKSLTLIAVKSENPDLEYGSLWNELIQRAPHFPHNTLFYNHGRHSKYGDIIKKIKHDQKMFMSLWGFYDDEAAQINNIIYNASKIITNDSKLIPNKNDFKWNCPVIICGSGPSIDERIKQLKKIRNKCILISAGTSLLPLLRNNLIPDYHVELESDFSVLHSLNSVGDLNILKSIPLITGIQSTPIITTMFKEVYYFVKDSSAAGGLIEDDINKLKDATPTCVNAAFSLAIQFESTEIYLFGTDFGFYSQTNNHSKDSIYNLNIENTETFKKSNNKNIENSFISPGYSGDCYTTDMYYTTKRRIEFAIKLKKHSYKFDVYNCSDGLKIEDTNHINSSHNIKLKKQNIDNIKSIFRGLSRDIEVDIEKDIKLPIQQCIDDISKLLSDNVKDMNPGINELSTLCWSISNYISTTYKRKYGSLHYIIRGSIWHYLLSGYTISYACNEDNRTEVIRIWKDNFYDFLVHLPKKIELVLHRSRHKEDVSLKSTIKDDIDGF
jgi:hypothetical protein